jgi:oxygen-dependent protoporphyrinogen oxidase
VVVGGGPSGLVLGRELLACGEAGGLEVAVLEARPRPGGKAWTERVDGYLIEHGPEGFLDSAPATLALAGELGLAERLLPAAPQAAKRYLYARGALRPVPTNPAAFLASGILSLRGRLAVLGEPFRSPGRNGDESVAAFARRRLGREAATTLVGAMVRGVYAGDAEDVSMPSSFPRLAALEREHGSLVRALIARRRRRGNGVGPAAPGEGAVSAPAAALRETGSARGGPSGPAGRLTSFVGGMGELGSALARALGRRFEAGRPASAVRRAGAGWRVELADGSSEFCDAVALAVEPWSAARLLAAESPALADVLAEIPAAPAVVVALGFALRDLGRPLDGFGFLVPPGGRLRMLGCLWSSATFGHRAPAGHALLRVLLGGRDRAALDLPDDRLVALVLEELAATMGVRGAPTMVRIVRWPNAIPQYTLGHARRLSRIGQELERLPGLHLSGNGYRGIALNDCVTNAQAAARVIVASFAAPARSATRVGPP